MLLSWYALRGEALRPPPCTPPTRFYFLIDFPCYLLSFVFIHMYSHLFFFFDPPFPQFLDDFHYDRPYLFFLILICFFLILICFFFLIPRFCFFLILICFFFDPLATGKLADLLDKSFIF